MQQPITHQIPYQDPTQIFIQFAEQPWTIFFDSAQRNKTLGRYSFIAIDPFLKLISKNQQIKLNDNTSTGNPFLILQQQLSKYTQQLIPELPPFQGGAAGYLGYELRCHLEKLTWHPTDDMNFPDMAIGFYDLVIAFDHKIKKSWIFSSGFPEINRVYRQQHAAQRCHWLVEQLSTVTPAKAGIQKNYYDSISIDTIKANLTHETFIQSVEKILDYIEAGDIYQANFSQRFSTDLPESLPPYEIFRRLRQINPAPFASYFQLDDIVLASASPEQFLQLSQGTVKTRPIKGTRPRSDNLEQDNLLAHELKTSEKDQAENLMIVDLLRNDLARICQHHSINVTQLCSLESYTTVHHLVSEITGQLKPELNAVDLLIAAFPGGSITGAPKIRAMEIITELEPQARGPYCGSMVYFAFNGDMNSSIIIRTIAIKNNRLYFHVGSGIVADSDPEQEYEETLIKAKALFDALTISTNVTICK